MPYRAVNELAVSTLSTPTSTPTTQSSLKSSRCSTDLTDAMLPSPTITRKPSTRGDILGPPRSFQKPYMKVTTPAKEPPPAPVIVTRSASLPRRLDTQGSSTSGDGDTADNTNDKDGKPRYPGISANHRPLSPRRLAKLANAFGVSTPIPASLIPTTNPGTTLTRGATTSATLGRRKTNASRLLIHVIPPSHFPSENPTVSSSASGYHTQFRRGILTALYPTLQGQLGAIAREYGLPSTGGMVLYLLEAKDESIGDEFMGPRITDDAWKLLWSNVIKTDREETMRSVSSQSMHSLPHFGPPTEREVSSSPEHTVFDSPEKISPPSQLRPLRTARSIVGSTSGDQQDPHTRAPSLPTPSRSSTNTTNTTSSLSNPVVGKIEFDIDRRKAPWYDQWLQRTLSRMPSPSPGVSPLFQLTLSNSDTGSPAKDQDGNSIRGDFLTPNRLGPGRNRLNSNNSARSDGSSQAWFYDRTYTPGQKASDRSIDESGGSGYEALSDGSSDEEEGRVVQGVRRMKRDPLGDVFPSDGASWADLRDAPSSSTPRKKKRGKGYSPALDEEVEEEQPSIPPQDDVSDVIGMLSSPIALKHGYEFPAGKGSRVHRSGSLSRRGIPPPLRLIGADGRPAIAEDEDDDTSKDDTVETPEEDDDWRQSQILMRKKLDDLEKALAQLSPRDLEPHPQEYPIDNHRSPSIGEFLEHAHRFPTPPLRSGSNGALVVPNTADSAYFNSRHSPRMDGSGGQGSPWTPNTPNSPLPSPRFAISPSEDTSQAYRQNSLDSAYDEHSLLSPHSLAGRMYRPPTPGNVVEPPPRNSSLPQPQTPITTPSHSSKFSTDGQDDPNGADASVKKTPSNSGSVRGIRRLWRKSGPSDGSIDGGRQSVQAAVPPMPTQSPNNTLTSQQSRDAGPSKGHARNSSGLDPFHFDQEARYSAANPSSNTPQQASRSNAPTHQKDASISSGRTRGILKGWNSKSSKGRGDERVMSISAPILMEKNGMSVFATEPREAPSINGRSGFSSTSSSSNGPATPSSPTESSELGHKTSIRRKPPPTIPEHDEHGVLQQSTAPLRAGGPPRRTLPSLYPGSTSPESDRYRPSLDDPSTPRFSQFEIVSPPTR